jgi:hypothetical protein
MLNYIIPANCWYHYEKVAPVKPNMLKKCFATLGKVQLNVKVKSYPSMYNYIIPDNCWYHYLRRMTNLSLRNGEHEVSLQKRQKSMCFVTLGKGQLNVNEFLVVLWFVCK